MNRRHFLRWLGGTAAGVALAPTLDLDKLLWVPGEKTIFLPPAPALLLPGDIFTIQGFYAINPITRKRSDFLQQFVATTAIADDGGIIPLKMIHPSIAVPAGVPKGRVGRVGGWKPAPALGVKVLSA